MKKIRFVCDFNNNNNNNNNNSNGNSNNNNNNNNVACIAPVYQRLQMGSHYLWCVIERATNQLHVSITNNGSHVEEVK